LEIGQPFSACSAAAWKPAWSSPGTTPVTSSTDRVTVTPPPSFGSGETVEVTCSRSGALPA
jgi:hypothetical protein